jgi:hypothetical protein
MSSPASRSTVTDELRITARVLTGLPTQPYAPDQWTVVFVDLGHDLVVLATLPTPAPRSETAVDLSDVLVAQDLASYEVTAFNAAAAERRAREYFAAERALVKPWPDDRTRAGFFTTVPAQGGPTAWGIVTHALASCGITAYGDDDAGNEWLVVPRDQSASGYPMDPGPYVAMFVYNPDGDPVVTVNRAPDRTGDRWHLVVGEGDGTGVERQTHDVPTDRLSECIEFIAGWVTRSRR